MIVRLALSVALAGAAAAMPACRGERSDAPPRQFFPSLDDQQRWDPQEQTDVYADGRTSREPVAGTVAFGWTDDPADPRRPNFLKLDDAVYLGVGPNGNYLEAAPISSLMPGEATADTVRDLIARGQDRYDIYCISCHGGTGKGDGLVGTRWSYPLPNFHDPQYQPGGEKGQDGYLFHVIRNGVANAPGMTPALRMPAYSEKVDEHDAWAIVLYIRSLQRSLSGSIEEVPEAERQRLMRIRGASGAGSGEESPS